MALARAHPTDHARLGAVDMPVLVTAKKHGGLWNIIRLTHEIHQLAVTKDIVGVIRADNGENQGFVRGMCIAHPNPAMTINYRTPATLKLLGLPARGVFKCAARSMSPLWGTLSLTGGRLCPLSGSFLTKPRHGESCQRLPSSQSAFSSESRSRSPPSNTQPQLALAPIHFRR